MADSYSNVAGGKLKLKGGSSTGKVKKYIFDSDGVVIYSSYIEIVKKYVQAHGVRIQRKCNVPFRQDFICKIAKTKLEIRADDILEAKDNLFFEYSQITYLHHFNETISVGRRKSPMLTKYPGMPLSQVSPRPRKTSPRNTKQKPRESLKKGNGNGCVYQKPALSVFFF